jgi:hypothetical protein
MHIYVLRLNLYVSLQCLMQNFHNEEYNIPHKFIIIIVAVVVIVI